VCTAARQSRGVQSGKHDVHTQAGSNLNNLKPEAVPLAFNKLEIAPERHLSRGAGSMQVNSVGLDSDPLSDLPGAT
jgi:hypothetical protein